MPINILGFMLFLPSCSKLLRDKKGSHP